MTVMLWESLAKFGLFLVGKWAEKSKNRAELLKLYHGFLKQISVHSSIAVERTLAVEKLLKDAQNQKI
jgi:hypothetical protein